MNRQKTTKRAYFAPRAKICFTRVENLILAGSVSGGHHDAGDDETYGAKRSDFFDDEEDPWIIGGSTGYANSKE